MNGGEFDHILVYYRGIFLNTKSNRTKQFSSILPILNCFRHAGILFLQLSWTVHEQNKMYNKHKFMCHRRKIYVPENENLCAAKGGNRTYKM
jgi:hypothetical protein